MSTPGERGDYGSSRQLPSVVQLAIERRKVAYRCAYCRHLFHQDDPALSRAKELGVCPNCKAGWNTVQVI